MDFDLDSFRNALVQAFRMEDSDADLVVKTVADCFIGEDEVNDEDLDKETRSLFYSLEAEGLMTFRRTEYKFEGAVRRAFFWRLTEDVLAGRVGQASGPSRASEEEEMASLYQTLQDDCWHRDAVSA